MGFLANKITAVKHQIRFTLCVRTFFWVLTSHYRQVYEWGFPSNFYETWLGFYMIDNDSEKSQPYEEVENWPPYTYREYPEVTTENIRAFTEFLNTENEVGLKMELQPWISFCDSRCTFCYFPNESFSRKLVKPYLAVFKKELMAIVIGVGAYWALRRQK
jgi:hypothetical protein